MPASPPDPTLVPAPARLGGGSLAERSLRGEPAADPAGATLDSVDLVSISGDHQTPDSPDSSAHTPAPPPGMASVPLSRSALAALAGGLERGFVPGPELGRGGVGVVRLARHVLLDRDVALKSINPTAHHKSARRNLLREAAATAALDHPNVVPVHDVVVDADGDPHVVLGRVQGRPWLHYLLHPADITPRFGARDQLGWHLSVLEQLCSAVHHAHERGILHRDLKPDNVMIGPLGEVYLLDWGLAVRLDDRGPARLRLAASDRRIVGTPRFMAPEMARGDGPALCPATDVYLLGGLLYAVLTGRGPHPGLSIEETLAAVPRFVPELPPTTPPRLAALVRRAMAPEPAARFPTAEALRQELITFREQRSAHELAAAASARLRRLEQDLARDPPPPRDALYRSFDEVRFGHQQALRVAPSLREARDGLRAAFSQMIRHELRAGDLRAASVLLDQLEEPPEELVAARAQLISRQESEALRQAREAAERDPRLGQRTRIFVFSAFMLSWAILPMVGWLTEASLAPAQLLLTHSIAVVVVIGLVVWARDSLSRTAINRQVAAWLVVLQITLLAGDVAGAALGMDPLDILTFNQLVFAMLAALAAASIDRRFAWAVPGYLVALVAGLIERPLVLPFDGLANLTVGIVGFAIWAPPLDQLRTLFVRDEDEQPRT